MTDGKPQQYDNVFYLPESKKLSNGQFASICEPEDSRRACARLAINKTTKKQSYYIKMQGGHVVDPYQELYITVDKNKKVKYKKVTGELFRKYVKYLQNGGNYLIREIERTLTDG